MPSVQRHRRFIDMILFLSLRHVMLIVWNHYNNDDDNYDNGDDDDDNVMLINTVEPPH